MNVILPSPPLPLFAIESLYSSLSRMHMAFNGWYSKQIDQGSSYLLGVEVCFPLPPKKNISLGK